MLHISILEPTPIIIHQSRYFTPISSLFRSQHAVELGPQSYLGGERFPCLLTPRPRTLADYSQDLTSTDLRCNQGGLTGGSTTTITVKAGAAFSFTSDVAVYHAGPTSM